MNGFHFSAVADMFMVPDTARAEAAQQALPGLLFCANWKGGVSVGDCIQNGHCSTEIVAMHLRAGTDSPSKLHAETFSPAVTMLR